MSQELMSDTPGLTQMGLVCWLFRISAFGFNCSDLSPHQAFRRVELKAGRIKSFSIHSQLYILVLRGPFIGASLIFQIFPKIILLRGGGFGVFSLNSLPLITP